MWRLRQIGEGRMDARTACMIIPSEADLLASEAAFLREAEQASREIAAKKEATQPAQPEIAPQDIIFERRQGDNPPSYAHVRCQFQQCG